MSIYYLIGNVVGIRDRKLKKKFFFYGVCILFEKYIILDFMKINKKIYFININI